MRSTPSCAGSSPGGTFRHGKVFGLPMGEPAHRYIAEWEFADQAVVRGRRRERRVPRDRPDARDRGFPPPTVEFASLA